jgi:ribosomal protein L37E
MFFILFGTRTTPSVLGQVPYVCPRCGQNSWHRYVRRAQHFTLFFIPIFPIGKSTLATCMTCGHHQYVSNEYADNMFAQLARQRPLPPHHG